MSGDQFLEQISPVPDHDYFHFVKGDLRLGQYAFSRAYLNFTHQDDIFLFKEKFDGYVFVDAKGNEYTAIVEFAPFQKIPKKRSKKRDAKCGTIETDADYLNFLESLKKPDEGTSQTAETYLEEIETREKELKANNGVPKITTPLIEYLKQRKIEQQKIREEKREERKRKEIEKKRIREEERRRRKAEKDKAKEKQNDAESQPEKEAAGEGEDGLTPEDSKQIDPIVQVLKNPEREKEVKEHVPQKSKEYFLRPNKDKDRTKREWEPDKQRDKTRQRERMRTAERIAFLREKDRREKGEYKSHSNYKGSHNENVANPNEPEYKETSHAKGETVDDPDKSVGKQKRDKSCPGSVEMSGTRCPKETSCDEGRETSDAGAASACDVAETCDGSKNECSFGEGKDSSKDPRVDRRIKNKDRPALAIYRAGARRFSTQRSSPQKEISTSTSNSSTPSPSPTPPLTPAGAKAQVKDCDKNKTCKTAFGPESSNDSLG